MSHYILLKKISIKAKFLINNYLPMYGITMAFREPDFSLDNVLNSPFNGFENFKFLFENDQLGLYIRNTVLYNLAFLVLNIVIPVTMAILFTNIRRNRAKKLYQTAKVFNIKV